MQRLVVSGAVPLIYRTLGVKGLMKCNNGESDSTFFKFWLKLDSHGHRARRLCAFLLSSELSLTKYLSQQKKFPENTVLKNETHFIPNTGLPSV